MITRSSMTCLVAACMLVLSAPAFAQSPAPAPSGGTQPAAEQLLKPEQLDQLVAPIALYPDPLLAEVLMAATYPLEVVSADRWVKQNKNLKGDQLKTQAERQNWDESVTSLTATPDVLAMMSDKLDWTQQLGDAVLAQQADVMDAVQRLRAKAQAQKTLASTEQQKVTTKTEQGREIIVIEPAAPDTIYVPYYDPAVVYGVWPYPAYPPYFFPRPGYIAASAIATGIAFGTGYAIGRWASGDNYWGGGVNWGGNTINVNRPINIDNTKINNFVHNPEHRHGVRYDNDNVRQRFSNRATGAGDRHLDFRGHDGKQVVRPDRDGASRDRVGAGDRRGTKERPNVAKRDVKRPDASRHRPDVSRHKPDIARHTPAAVARKHHSGAFSNVSRGGAVAHAHAARGRASLGGGPHIRSGGGPRGGGIHRGGGRRR